MKKAGFIFLSLLILLAFCKKKEEDYTISGKVIDAKTGNSLENTLVNLSASGVQSGTYNSNYQSIASTYTDQSGAFSFNIEKSKASGFRLSFAKENYFEFTSDISSSWLQSNGDYSGTFSIAPAGFIKLHVRNASPVDVNDEIIYHFTPSALNCFTCCNDSVHNGHGMNYENTIYCKTFGNEYMTISWNIIKDSISIFRSDSILCISFDTTTYNLSY